MGTLFQRIVVCVLGTAALAGQTENRSDFQWLAYSADPQIRGRWGLHFDTGYRFLGDGGTRQWLVRPGVNYALNRFVTLQSTYAYFVSQKPGSAERIPEHRAHQQITVRQPVGGMTLRHRFRLEERWLERSGGGWREQVRPRYMLRGEIPLGRRGIYLAAYDEVLYRSGPWVLDQNRLYGGIGFRTGGASGVEMGWMNMRSRPGSGGRLENHQILVISISNFLPAGRR